MTKITLTNDFHSTAVALVVANHEPGDSVIISASQYHRAHRELCGVTECRCGGAYRNRLSDRGYTLDEGQDQYGDRMFSVLAPMDN